MSPPLRLSRLCDVFLWHRKGTKDAEGPARTLYLARLPVLGIHQPIEISAAVVPVLHGPRMAMPMKQLGIQIVDQERFDVRRAFGRHGVARERKVGRREYAGLGVVDVNVLHER